MDDRWLPHYRVIKKTGPYSYLIQNQKTGKNKRAHAEDLQAAAINDLWDVPQNRDKRPTRYVTHDMSDSESDITSDSDDEHSDVNEKSEDDCTPTVTVDQPNDTTDSQLVSESESDNDSSQMDMPTSASRPQRQAKLNATAKIKCLQEVVQAKPSTDIDHLIQEKLDNSLKHFMNSFTTSFANSLSSMKS